MKRRDIANLENLNVVDSKAVLGGVKRNRSFNQIPEQTIRVWWLRPGCC